MPPICTVKQLQIFGLTIAGFSLVSILITLFVFNYPSFAKERVIDALLFKNNSDSMVRFETTSDLKNLQLSFYVYNITNPTEVKQGAKINLREIGPFVYSEFKSRRFVDNNQSSGLIDYKLTRRFIFNQEASWEQTDPRNLTITWINIPLLGISDTINKKFNSPLERIAIYKYFDVAIKEVKEDAFIVDSVHNLLIGGSFRPIFDYMHKHLHMVQVPLLNSTFGILYGKNETENDHLLTTAAGFGPGRTYHDLNQYIAMDGQKRLKVWKDTPQGCNNIGGTDGEFFSPFGDRNNNLEIFPLDLCRKLSLKYQKNATMIGIHTWKYVLDQKTLESPSKNSENSCYCLSQDPSAPECTMDGLIDLRNCNNQTNVYASGAHFWAGSDNYTLGFTGDGKDKDPEKHEPSFLVEPNTGLALKVMVPIQFNVKLTPSKVPEFERNNFEVFNFLENVTNSIYLPFAWVVESSEMTEQQSQLLKRELLIFDTWLISMVLGGSIILIVAIIVAAVILCLKLRIPTTRIARETDPLVRSRPRSYV